MSYAQTVPLLQTHKLDDSFATLQRLCRWCTDPAYPVCPQRALIACVCPWFWSCSVPKML